MTEATQALLPVTQLAREAVAKQVEEAFYDECEYAQELRQGLHDSDPNLQHFARFERDIRASISPSPCPRDVGTSETLANALTEARDAVAFLDNVKSATMSEQIAVGHDHHDRAEAALRKVAALTPSALSADGAVNDEAFCSAVWDALKGDHNDLRRQQIILNAHRKALPSHQGAE